MPNRRTRPADLITFELSSILLHQSITFDADGPELRSALIESILFRGQLKDGAARVEWVRVQSDGESFGCPLGVVTIAQGTTLLEAWSEARLARLRRAVESAVTARLTADETRIFRLEEALRRLEALFDQTTARHIASRFIREAWAFVPREDLHNRTPVMAMLTGRGRDAILRVWPDALREIRKDSPTFPEVTIDELRALLFDERAHPPPSSPAPPPVSKPRTIR